MSIGSDTARPSITIAQIVAGIPLVANLLAAWGVWSPSLKQQETLRDTLIWAFALIGGDAVIRLGRNISDGLARRHSANVTLSSGSSPPRAPSA